MAAPGAAPEVCQRGLPAGPTRGLTVSSPSTADPAGSLGAVPWPPGWGLWDEPVGRHGRGSGVRESASECVTREF